MSNIVRTFLCQEYAAIEAKTSTSLVMRKLEFCIYYANNRLKSANISVLSDLHLLFLLPG